MTTRIQEFLDRTQAGEKVEIDPNRLGAEFEGPVVVRKSMTVDGGGCTVWAAKGPVLTIDTDGPVILKDISLEVTGDAERDYALAVERCGSLNLDNVHVVGKTRGAAPQVPWEYPRAVMLRLRPGEESAPFSLRAPEPYTLRWNMMTVGSGEEKRPAGASAKTFKVLPGATPGASLRGKIELVSLAGKTVGTIEVAGWVKGSTGDLWRYPRRARFVLRPGQESPPLPFLAPEPHRLRWNISTIGSGEGERPAGASTKTFTVPADARPWSSLHGRIEIVTLAGKVIGTIEVSGYVRGQVLLPLLCLAGIIAAGGAAFSLWHTRSGSQTEVLIQEQCLDYGLLQYGSDRQVSGTQMLSVVCRPCSTSNLMLTLVTRLRLTDGSWTSRPSHDSFVLGGALTQIRVPCMVSNLSTGAKYDLEGSAVLSVNATNAKVSPTSIPVKVRIRPRGHQ